jgi:putative colanic acid biosynthesis glycosyltransferase
MTLAFTIITVTLNNQIGLIKTAQSIHAQTASYEWIVIDGGSSDGTLDWLGKSDAQWISEPDQGIYDAMNKGIARARGDYLLFLNAGDYLAGPDVLAKLIQKIDSAHRPDFIYGDSLEERAGLPPVYKKARDANIVRGMFTHHQAMLYRRETPAPLRYDTTYKIAADYKFTAQFLAQAKNILYCPLPICLFEPGGISQRQVKLGRREQFIIRREVFLCPLWKNILIFTAQIFTMALRRTAPSLYWRLKQRP